ncbi:hypothetical protein P7K49_002658, partial [Saguinus oedipus]
ACALWALCPANAMTLAGTSQLNDPVDKSLLGPPEVLALLWGKGCPGLRLPSTHRADASDQQRPLKKQALTHAGPQPSTRLAPASHTLIP